MRVMAEMTPEQRERYVRWQEHRVTQLSFVNNLFLGFAVASLGYVISLKLEKKLGAVLSADAALCLFAVSAALGCVATVSKLLDYRYSARKIKDGGRFNACMAKYCGPVTWGFLWAQILTYAAGAYVFVSAVLYA